MGSYNTATAAVNLTIVSSSDIVIVTVRFYTHINVKMDVVHIVVL